MNSKCASVIAVLAILVAVLVGYLMSSEENPSMFLSSKFLRTLMSLTDNEGTLVIKGTQEFRKTKYEIYQNLKHKDSSGRQLKHTTKPGNALNENKPGNKGHKENPKPLGERIKDFFRPEDKDPKHRNSEDNDPEHQKSGNRGSKAHDPEDNDHEHLKSGNRGSKAHDPEDNDPERQKEPRKLTKEEKWPRGFYYNYGYTPRPGGERPWDATPSLALACASCRIL
jgi:hypothetical protein